MATQFVRRRILAIIFFNLALILVGTLGYFFIEGWSVLDAFYMTVITIGSVGYGEVRELSISGRIFTTGIIMVGVGTAAASLTILTETILSAELRGKFRVARMQKKLDNLSDHIIICGYGRMGQNAFHVLMDDNRREIVIVDNDLAQVQQLQDEDRLVLEGDATDDDILRQAGIERAWGLITAAGEDSVNLFVVVSARALNPNLTIVARSSRAQNEQKMLRAGANRVVSPYSIGGKRMANSLMRPHLTQFIEELTFGDVEVWLEEMRVEEESKLIGQTMAQLDLRRRTGVTVLAILRSAGILSSDGNTQLQVDDQLILIGTRQQLDQLEALLEE